MQTLMMMSVGALLVSVLLYQAADAAFIGARAGCSFSINSDLSDPQPLVLRNNWTPANAFVLPVDNSGTITFSAGATFTLACPGSTLRLDGASAPTTATATCVSGTTFQVNNVNVPFSAITCASNTAHVARYSGRSCLTKYREVEIGFVVGSVFIPHIYACFDDAGQNTLYSQFNLTKTIGGYQVGYPRPSSFAQGSFYSVGTPNVDTLYSRNQQRITINTLLGLSQTDTTYIHGTNDYFLARGHLVAKADFVYGSQHRLTFYFVNVAPQWQTFNGGNWNTLEGNVRDFASAKGLDLTVYTGTYGVTTLPHASTGEDVPLYLYVDANNNKGIPVPQLYWKALYNPSTKAGIVFLGVNNPYHDNIAKNRICTDISSRVSWLTWKASDQKLGYSYACTVDDFRKTVTNLPSFQVNSILL